MQDSESEGGSGSESDSEPTEYDSEEKLMFMLQELLQRDEAKRAGKVRERDGVSGRVREADAAEAEEAAWRAAYAQMRVMGGRELLRGDRAKHANSTHVEPRLKSFTYGGQLRAAFGKMGSASRCMMFTLYDRE